MHASSLVMTSKKVLPYHGRIFFLYELVDESGLPFPSAHACWVWPSIVFMFEHQNQDCIFLYIILSNLYISVIKLNLPSHTVVQYLSFLYSNIKYILAPKLGIRCFGFPKIETMSKIIRVSIQNSLPQNKNRED